MRRGKFVGLLLIGILLTAAVPAGTATAGSSTIRNDQVRYCKEVDAYRLKTCAKALLPPNSLGRHLRWVLALIQSTLGGRGAIENRRHQGSPGPDQPTQALYAVDLPHQAKP